MALKLIPFHNSWPTLTQLDLRAIYRRPRNIVDEYDQRIQTRDESGNPLWDITPPQRVIDHTKHLAKGYQYVTLASRNDLMKAASAGTIENWKQYDQHQVGGPWHWKMYLDSVVEHDSEASTKLDQQVEQFGAEAVEAIRRASDPGFTLPDRLKTKAKKPATKVPA